MIRKPETVAFWVGRLPHWEVVDGRYFVTLSLKGAIPVAGRREISACREHLNRAPRINQPDWIRRQRAIFIAMERWLDRIETVRHLEIDAVAEMLFESIQKRVDLGIWNMFHYVLMPNHIHLFFELTGPPAKDGTRLRTTMRGFKRWTANRTGEILGLEASEFWQREWFDHWSRSELEDDRIASYIRKNPEKAMLVQRAEDYPWSSFYRKR